MEHLPGPSRPGSVVLDIGGDIGAAIIHTPPSHAGAELEIRRIGEPWDGRHVAVRARHLPNAVTYSAVFDHLLTGRYEVRTRGADPNKPHYPLHVAGGKVTELRISP